MSESLEQRLTELEVKLAFIDEAVAALTGADADQAQRIAALERIVRELRGELATMRLSAPGMDPHDEPPPPHY